jgi:hypothetical protein
MTRRILKVTLKGIIGISLIIGLLYGGFHLWEFSTGAKYVDYLKENSETIPLSESFSFKMLDKDIKENRLILVGEIHGFEEPQKFDYELFTHLHKNHNVKQYYAELDFVQSLVLNQYLDSGDEKLLNDALRKWAVFQGRNNKDYYDKYRKLQQLYEQSTEQDKFKFIGIDKLQDVKLTLRYLNSLNKSTELEIKEAVDLSAIQNQISQLDSIYANSPDTLFVLNHIKDNFKHYTEKTDREKVLFENFHSLYNQMNKSKDKAYGYFGLFHVFQYQINGKQPLAAQIRMSDLGLENNILSMNFLMMDSYMVMPSNQLPSFMSDGGKYTKMPISSDQMLFIYIYGIKDFKRMTPENHKSLVKMNSENSPYATSNRMSMTIQLLPVAEKFEFNEKGKAYVQYTVFVRNSDWAEPEE